MDTSKFTEQRKFIFALAVIVMLLGYAWIMHFTESFVLQSVVSISLAYLTAQTVIDFSKKSG